MSTTLSDDPSCESTGATLTAQPVHADDTSDIDDDTLVPAVEVSPVTVMDNLLTECFLQALKTKLTKDDVPMLTSTFYRSHMLDLWCVLITGFTRLTLIWFLFLQPT